jgi:hypothetical protein
LIVQFSGLFDEIIGKEKGINIYDHLYSTKHCTLCIALVAERQFEGG